MLKISFVLAAFLAVGLANHEPMGYPPFSPVLYYTLPVVSPLHFPEFSMQYSRPVELRAITRLDGQGITGNITFTQLPDGKVHVAGTIYGLPQGHYGFHVHEKGDITGGCLSTGAHFNPEHKDHGHPNDENRHVGDLGNVMFNEQNYAHMDFVDGKISLIGPHCILGRAVVLHEKEDDFGRSSHPDSKKTGNAGGRVACGVIGLLDPIYGWHTGGASTSAPTFAMAVLISTMLAILL